VPFDLTFEEPQAVAPRETLPDSRRATLRKAIGQELVDRTSPLREATTEEAGSRSTTVIPLHDGGLIEDLKHDWLAVPAVELLESVVGLSNFDLSDDAIVGARLRGETATLLARAEEVSELLQFIDLFAPSLIHDLVRPAYVDGLMLACTFVEWMTSETEAESAEAGESFEAIATEIPNHLVVLCGSPYLDRVSPAVEAKYEDEFAVLIGVEFPRHAERWTDVLRSLEADGHDLCKLGRRQLAYVGEYRATDQIWARNFFALGLRIGRSVYPLLAHRAAFLAWRLFEAALGTDEEETLAALHGLFDAETLWMVESQADYLAALDRYLAGDDAAIIEAYGDLAEGTLRRYGSLVLALERIAGGQRPQEPLVVESIGDLEAQLGVWQDGPLPMLILRFLERGLRNADAHANAIVDAEGNLQVRLRDGTVETFVPNHVYGRTAGLRSVLDGIDIAMNHASIRDKEQKGLDPTVGPMPPMSETMFERVVQQFAEEHTSGVVSGVRRRSDTLTMTYHGAAQYDELHTFVSSLTRLLGPSLPRVRILDEQGDPLEVFLPPDQSVGRNDPCPCGSGKKYKRCHGS
jgi:hypothetical protein